MIERKFKNIPYPLTPLSLHAGKGE